jgi:alpha-tubulin suppressor-like RCC1 family protein
MTGSRLAVAPHRGGGIAGRATGVLTFAGTSHGRVAGIAFGKATGALVLAGTSHGHAARVVFGKATGTLLLTGAATSLSDFMLVWGQAAKGQMGGNWAGSPCPFPEQVLTLDEVVQCASGFNSTFALLRDGTIRSWGANDVGQSGKGGGLSEAIYPLPGPVVGEKEEGLLEDVLALSFGGSHALVLMEDRTVRTWGGNLFGELANGKSGHKEKEEREKEEEEKEEEFEGGGKEFGSSSPITPEGALREVEAVASGHQVSIVLLEGGKLKRWGKPVDEGEKLVPTLIQSALKEVSAISCSYSHALALHENGTISAWGSNHYGELGDGTRRTKPLEEGTRPAVTVLGLPEKVIAISAATYTSYALMESGKVMAWGLGNVGQLGNGTSGTEELVVVVKGNTVKGSKVVKGMAEEEVEELESGMEVTGPGIPAKTKITNIQSKEEEEAGEYPTEIHLNNNATLTQTGASLTCTEIGPVHRSEPVYVTGLEHVKAISAGTGGVIKEDFQAWCEAIKTDNSLWAWGYSAEGQLGDGTEENKTTPVKIATGIESVAAGENDTAAILASGSVAVATISISAASKALTVKWALSSAIKGLQGEWRVEYRRVVRNRSTGTFKGTIKIGSKEITGIANIEELAEKELLTESTKNLSGPGIPKGVSVGTLNIPGKSLTFTNKAKSTATANGEITVTAKNQQQEEWHNRTSKYAEATREHTFTGLAEPVEWTSSKLYEVAVSSEGTYGKRIIEGTPL